jgi:hypothetical protein
MKTKIENYKKQVIELGLAGKSVKDLLSVANYLYWRIYNYAKRESLWLTEVFFDLGLTLNRIDGLNSVKRLDDFMGKMFSYENKDWSEFPVDHKSLIKRTLKMLDINFESFLVRYNVSYTNLIESKRVYNSIDEIKKDLILKGLENSSISQITAFDGGNIIANIQSFAEKNNFRMKDIWFALNISYQDGIVFCQTGVKTDYVYHNDEEMIKDFIQKKLVGKTKREVFVYDNGTTVGRVNKYAKRLGVDVQLLWEKVEVKNSFKRNIELPFSNLDQLKVIVKEKGLVGKTIQEVNTLDQELVSWVKKYSRKGISIVEIWKYVGVARGHGFYSIDDILNKIRISGYKNPRDVRADLSFYKQITRFVASRRQEFSMEDIWQKSGFSISSEGRPSKKKI